ncbi:hypothetical protein BN970_07113 [Mycolicibacterium conceptionense]|uniref:Uncharacterized protein n=1 Tax=Mycolicibacterium conceptionense TaxID=451644 RepID=A0A0U1DZ56_9MYCO|nr:hypothetical protein BN970_07113 [Mycolicibacterium conceptionense]
MTVTPAPAAASQAVVLCPATLRICFSVMNRAIPGPVGAAPLAAGVLQATGSSPRVTVDSTVMVAISVLARSSDGVAGSGSRTGGMVACQVPGPAQTR